VNAIYGTEGSHRALKSMAVVSEDGVAIINHFETVASVLCSIRRWGATSHFCSVTCVSLRNCLSTSWSSPSPTVRQEVRPTLYG